MTKYSKLPAYAAMRVHRIHPALYGDLLAGVYGRLDDGDMQAAERVVDFVLGQLALVPPMPDHDEVCGHSYFTEDGEWQHCIKEHDPTDKVDLSLHRSHEHDWDSDDTDDKAYEPEDSTS